MSVIQMCDECEIERQVEYAEKEAETTETVQPETEAEEEEALVAETTDYETEVAEVEAEQEQPEENPEHQYDRFSMTYGEHLFWVKFEGMEWRAYSVGEIYSLVYTEGVPIENWRALPAPEHCTLPHCKKIAGYKEPWRVITLIKEDTQLITYACPACKEDANLVAKYRKSHPGLPFVGTKHRIDNEWRLKHAGYLNGALLIGMTSGGKNIDIMDFLEKDRTYTVEEIAEICMLTRQTASKRVKEARGDRKLYKFGKGWRVYPNYSYQYKRTPTMADITYAIKQMYRDNTCYVSHVPGPLFGLSQRQLMKLARAQPEWETQKKDILTFLFLAERKRLHQIYYEDLVPYGWYVAPPAAKL